MKDKPMARIKTFLLAILLTVIAAPRMASADTGAKLDLETRKVDCDPDFSGWRFEVTNYGSQPVSLSSLEVHFWVESAQPLDAYNWVTGEVADATGQNTRVVQGVTATAALMPRFLADPSHPEADWEITVQCSDPGLLAAGGQWQGDYFNYHLDNWGPMSQAQDYSRASECGDEPDYYENPTVGLYDQGLLVPEWESASQPDPQTGLDPLPPLDVTGKEIDPSPIVSPLDGEQVCGQIQVVVRTSLPEWQIQWASQQTECWNQLQAQVDGDAWSVNWDTRGLKPGDYQVRLWDLKNQTAVQSITVKVGYPSYSQTFTLAGNGVPAGIALSGDDLDVLDQKDQTIQVFGPTASLIQTLGGYGTRLGELDQAFDLSADLNGTIYVADEGNGWVQVFSDNPCLLGYGILSHPTIVKATGSGIYVLDGTIIHRFDRNQKYLYSGHLDPAGAYGDMAVDDVGLIYVLNLTTQCVDVYSPDFLKINSWTNLSKNWTPASLSYSNGRLWMADSTRNMVVKLGLDGNPLASWGGYGASNEQFDQPYRILSDSQGGVYVSDVGNDRVQKFVLDPGNAAVSACAPIVCGTLNLSGLSADPNPFNPNLTSATLTYQLSEAAAVHLSVQNGSGTLVYQQDYLAGSFGGKSGLNQLSWAGTGQGTALPVGTYQVILQASAGGQQATAQLALGLSANMTPVPTATPQPTIFVGGPTSTNTPLPPAFTDTPLPGAPTATETPIPPAPTSTDTPPLAVPTNTPIVVPPTATPIVPAPTDTPVPPIPTHTPLPPTLVPTCTSVPLTIGALRLNPSKIDRLYGPADVNICFTLTASASMTIQLENSSGNVVFTQTFAGFPGANSFTYVYSGISNVGQRLPAGSYTFILVGIASGGATDLVKANLTITP